MEVAALGPLFLLSLLLLPPGWALWVARPCFSRSRTCWFGSRRAGVQIYWDTCSSCGTEFVRKVEGWLLQSNLLKC